MKLFQEDIDSLLNSSSCKDRSHCVVTFSAVVNDQDQVPDIPTNLFYFSSLADAQLINPHLEVCTLALEGTAFL